MCNPVPPYSGEEEEDLGKPIVKNVNNIEEKFPQLKKVTQDLEWKDISHEKYRKYFFEFGDPVIVYNPAIINISSRDSHRILTKDNKSFYISNKWIAFMFETDDENGWWF